MKKCIPFLVLLVLLFIQCDIESKLTDLSQLELINIPLETSSSGMPNLFVDANGKAYLSWLEFVNDSLDQFNYASLSNDKWSAKKTIASGTDWFANWADFPSLISLDDQGENLAAHFLQYSASGTYDYDVKITNSRDRGVNWSTPVKPHQDSVHAEHGFVSLLPQKDHTVFAAWLDGRYTKTSITESSDDHGHGNGGPMTLRAATINFDGEIKDEIELDARVCDCCQTDAAMGREGPVVVYRDRSQNEIRDIYITRKLASGWTLPKTVHQDNWKIAGCPVNGPAINIHENNVAVAWYTMADQTAKVMLALSTDDGNNFEQIIRIDEGDPLGRVDIEFNEQHSGVMITWMEQTKDGTYINLKEVLFSGEQTASRKLIQSDEARSSGFPILKKVASGYLIAYTTTKDNSTVVQTVFIPFPSKI